MIRASGLVLISALILSACGGGNNNREAYDDEGKDRLPILSGVSELEASPLLAGQAVLLPAPYKNMSWSQNGGNPSHNVGHVALGSSLKRAWSTQVGRGDQNYERIVSGPVSADGRVFAVDSEGTVFAVSLSTGAVLWRTPLDSDRDRSAVNYGGGVAVGDGAVFATSGHGFLVSLDAETGRENWRYQAAVPLRGSPTVVGDRVLMLTQDNQMIAIEGSTGDYIWDQVGIPESAGMLGAASPASDGTAVVMALSSGELVAQLIANGQVLWQDALSASTRLTPLANLADVDASPVIAGGRVYAVSHAGSMVAVDLRTGERTWEADVAGVNTPWVAGRFAFVVTIDGQVAALSLADGRAKWVTQLQRFVKQDKRKGLIKWNGPILAGDRLIITSSHGYILSVSPYTGEVLSGDTLPGGSNLPMLVVDETLVIHTASGQLVAYR